MPIQSGISAHAISDLMNGGMTCLVAIGVPVFASTVRILLRVEAEKTI